MGDNLPRDDSPREVHDRFTVVRGGLWMVHGRSTGCLWEFHGRSTGSLREVRGKSMRVPWEVHGSSMTGPRDVYEGSTGCTWEVRGRFTGNPRDVVRLLGHCRPFSVMRASIKRSKSDELQPTTSTNDHFF